MSVVLLRLSGPMQSWGDSSRFTVRATGREPSKSGVLGLVAAALGRTRDELTSDLCGLDFGVRIDQPGEMMRDFQTARPLPGSDSMPLSQRYYLSDARFLAALSGPEDLIRRIEEALCRPMWPLYLGRRSYPADVPVLRKPSRDYEDCRDALAEEPWLASAWYRRRCARSASSEYPDLEVVCDARSGESCEVREDVPLCFGKVRSYAERNVTRYFIPNPDAPNEADEPAAPSGTDGHDPMSLLG